METGLTEGSHCADCDTILVAQQMVDSLGGHDYTNWSVFKQPTYGEQGEEKRTDICEEVQTRPVAYLALTTSALTGETNMTTGKPHIEWNAVSDASAYEIYRATSKNGAFVKYYTTEHTFFNNLSAEPGKTYYYKIIAVSKVTEASNSAESAVLTKVCDCAQPERSIMLKDGKPWMRWDVVEGSYAFEIYRATSKNGTYYKMHTTQNAYYINTTAVVGKTYYYKLNALCMTSSYGEAKSITVK